MSDRGRTITRDKNFYTIYIQNDVKVKGKISDQGNQRRIKRRENLEVMCVPQRKEPRLTSRLRCIGNLIVETLTHPVKGSLG